MKRVKIQWLDEFLADEDRAARIIIGGAAWIVAIAVALAIMAIAWM
jgi:hypothetical protein